jgi:hypothetical protein
MKRAAIVLTFIVCALATAQVHPTASDTVSRAEVVMAARQALEVASRNLGRWLTFVTIAVLVAAVLAVWRIWSLSRQVARLEDLRSSWETRFAGTADEVLRLKRKLADSDSRAGKLEADMAVLRPSDPDAATAQVAMVQSELVAVRERLDRAEEGLEAVADHTVAATQERAMADDLIKTAAEERAKVEGLVTAAVDERARVEGLVRTAVEAGAKVNGLVTAAADERVRVEGLVKTAAEERAKVKGLVTAVVGERARVEGLVESAVKAQAGAEAAAVRAEAIARRAAAVDLLRAGDEKLSQQQYPAAVHAYTLCLDSLEGSPSVEPGLRFHALHNRALANLRQREFSRVLADAAEIESVESDRSDDGEATRALGVARLLSGVARLWQGDVAQALKDFADATAKDAGARAVILQDDDIAAWVKVNPRRAAPVKQYIRELGREPRQPRHSSPADK